MILKFLYHVAHPHIKEENIPYWWRRSLIGQLLHTLRKFITQNIAPNCVTNFMRVRLYRLYGFKIGGHIYWHEMLS